MQYPHSKINADCIIPAAGLSTRMGEWKLLLPFKDSSIIEQSISNALAVCSRVIVVVGHRSDELTERLKGYANLEIVSNPDYQQGMYSSIRQGVRRVTSDYFFICHADMPCIAPQIFTRLWEQRGEATVFPGTEQQSGHPVLLSARLKPVIEQEQQHTSMKALLKRYPMRFLNLDDPNIHLDIDTPLAYQQLIGQ